MGRARHDGGGTDINRAIAYCQGLIQQPHNTILVLISDLYEGGVTAQLAGLGAPAFACTPDAFPELMAAAIERRDIARWAAERGIVAARPSA